MAATQPAAAAEVDISRVRFWDLRLLSQDEIRSVARHCGDVPARLQDLVNVIIDKSVFNESTGSRRQTFDRERPSRKHDHLHHSSSPSSSPSFHPPPTTMESFGFASHRDLILHLCRQLRIAERDRTLYQSAAAAASASPHQSDGFRPIRLKNIARASPTCPQDSSFADSCPSNASSNGKVLNVSTPEMSHRSSKKMKTKEEARRNAGHFSASSTIEGRAISEYATERTSFHPMDKKPIVQLTGHACSSMEGLLLKEQEIAGSMMKGNLSATAELCDSKSFHSPVVQSSLASAEQSEHLVISANEKISLLCFTCNKMFANPHSLRRHASSTGHNVDLKSVIPGSPIMIKRYSTGRYRCVTCGTTYATLSTLRRHVSISGHTVETLPDTPKFDSLCPGKQEPPENMGEGQNHNCDIVSTPAKPKLDSLWPKYLKNKATEFKCSKCQRRFSTKQQYVHHLDLHFKKSRKTMGRPTNQPVVRKVSSRLSKRINGKSSRSREEDTIGQSKEDLKAKDEQEFDVRPVNPLVEEVNVQQMSERPQTNICQECGKAFTEFSRYTGHLSMHSRFRKFYTGEASKTKTKTNVPTRSKDSSLDNAANDLDDFDLKKLSDVGFRRLISGASGTYLSSLPAKILFSKA